MARLTITVTIDESAWRDLLEGWGDGSIHWDEEDSTPVYAHVIAPIEVAIHEAKLAGVTDR